MRSLAGPLLAICLVATACGGGDDVDSATTTTTAAPETTTTTVAPETTTTPTTTTTTTTTEVPAAEFEYSGQGEYSVGVATVTIDEDTDRPLTVDVWFPLADDVTGEPAEYTLLPGTFYTSAHAIRTDFTGLSTAEPWPFVVYSHGSGGQRWIHSNYTEFLASHGYVVAAPDHTGNTLLERFSGAALDVEAIALQRPNDVSSVIDAFYPPDTATELRTAVGDNLTDDIIITGHSFGGFTSYAMVSGVATDTAWFEPDSRVTAVLTLAPATGPQLLPDERLEAIDVPHMVIVGDSDDTTPIDPNVERPWDLVPGRPSYRVELVAGEHETFTDLCDYNEQLPQLESAPEFVVNALADFTASTCAPTAISLDRAQAITNSFAIRFLDEVTRGAPALADDNVVYDDDLRFLSK